jgi:hypothetical protein
MVSRPGFDMPGDARPRHGKAEIIVYRPNNIDCIGTYSIDRFGRYDTLENHF